MPFARSRLHSASVSAVLLLAGCAEQPASPEQTVEAVSPARPVITERQAAAPAAARAPIAQAGQNYAFAAKGGMRIEGNENQHDIILPTDILFDFDKSELRPGAEGLLTQANTYIAERGSDQLHVKGYTDSRGSDRYNYLLSMRRAGAVCEWLKANGRDFTNCIGRGKEEPIAPNARPDGSDDPVGRQQNRRVTLSVIKYPDVNAMLNKAREQAREATTNLPR